MYELDGLSCPDYVCVCMYVCMCVCVCVFVCICVNWKEILIYVCMYDVRCML